MKECPYCQEIFSSKQRLIYHLTKTNKCYSIEAIGVPPILIELMGGSSHGADEAREEIATLPQTPQMGLSKKPMDAHPNTGEEKHECLTCAKRFVSESNLNRHVLGNKCKKPKGKGVGKKGILQLESDSGEVLKIDPLPFADPYQAPSQRRAAKVRSDYNPTPLPSSTFNRDEGRPRPEHIYRASQAPFDVNQQPVKTSGIRYLDRDDYFNYLIHILGSKTSAISFIRNCAHRRLSGDVALIQKIHFDGREKTQHPFEVTDPKSKTLYYKSLNGMVADEKGLYVRNCLIENIQNCYLKLCNHIISSNFDQSETIFNGENHLKKIQEHLLELSDEKVKDRLLTLLIDAVNK